MQANLNLNNSSNKTFANPFNTIKQNSFFNKQNQKEQYGTVNTQQSNVFPFKNTTIQNSKQANLQNFGFAAKQPFNQIFNNTNQNANIIQGFKANQVFKTNQPNIVWHQLRLNRPVKPTNNKITDAMVKSVNCFENLLKYNLTEIRCKTYEQKMQLNQNNYQNQNNAYQFYNPNAFQQTAAYNHPQTNQNITTFSPLQNPASHSHSHTNMSQFNNMVYGYLDNLITSQSIFPLLTSFLENMGITSDILQFLMRMGLSQQEIKQFITRRVLLKNIQKQRVQRYNLLLQYPNLFPSKTQQPIESEQNCSLFGRFQANYHENIEYKRFIDFTIYKQDFKWSALLIEECQKQYLKENIVKNQQKQIKIKRLLDELEQIGLAKEVQLQRLQRKNRINKLYLGAAAAFNHQQKQIRLSQVNEAFGFPKNIPIRPKTFFFEPQK